MQLSSMVLAAAPRDHCSQPFAQQPQQQTQQQHLHHQYRHHRPHLLSNTQTRAHQPHPQVASALVSNPYSHHYLSPPSPPVEDVHKPSLPSISSLLGIADVERTGNDMGETLTLFLCSFLYIYPFEQPVEQARNSSLTAPTATDSPSHAQPSHDQQPSHNNPYPTDDRPEYNHQAYNQPGASTKPRMALPPTPPMGPDAIPAGNQSPSTASNRSSTSGPYYVSSALNNLEPHDQRQPVPTASMAHRPSYLGPSPSPYVNSPYSNSPYASSPDPHASADAQAYATSPGLYHQQPLPPDFPPSGSVSVVTSPTGTANPWQHHHYISASSQAAFPQSQDRYICQTCSKAFSRPSSLRIHSHSHTGEKPFKCPHAGCGKAFSVRSNMKRHERGCHGGGAGQQQHPVPA